MLGIGHFVKGKLPFTGDVSLESFKDPYMCCHLSLLYSISYSLYLCWSRTSLSSPICIIFHLILTWVSVSSDSEHLCRTTAVAEIPVEFTLLDRLFFLSCVCNARSQKWLISFFLTFCMKLESWNKKVTKLIFWKKSPSESGKPKNASKMRFLEGLTKI